MKQTILILTILSILTSCKKEESYMFKAFHHVKGSDTTCEEIGEANEKQVRGVIIASFNAG